MPSRDLTQAGDGVGAHPVAHGGVHLLEDGGREGLVGSRYRAGLTALGLEPQGHSLPTRLERSEERGASGPRRIVAGDQDDVALPAPVQPEHDLPEPARQELAPGTQLAPERHQLGPRDVAAEQVEDPVGLVEADGDRSGHRRPRGA